MALPKFLQPYLASYDLSGLDIKRDKRTIITAILNIGDTQAVKWLLKTYSLSDIKDAVKNPARGVWMKESLNYWRKVLEIKIPQRVSELAVFDLAPRPRLFRKFFKADVSA